MPLNVELQDQPLQSGDLIEKKGNEDAMQLDMHGFLLKVPLANYLRGFDAVARLALQAVSLKRELETVMKRTLRCLQSFIDAIWRLFCVKPRAGCKTLTNPTSLAAWCNSSAISSLRFSKSERSTVTILRVTWPSRLLNILVH